MTFAQRRNRLTPHFSEGIHVVKRRISVLIGALKFCQLLFSKNFHTSHNDNLKSVHQYSGGNKAKQLYWKLVK